MKLRIHGNSIRLRISPSEMGRLLSYGRVEETVHFGREPEACLTYALECAAQDAAVVVRYRRCELTVLLSSAAVSTWAEGEDVGIYGKVAAGPSVVQVAIEKDFACLDRSDAENADRYPNPKMGKTC